MKVTIFLFKTFMVFWQLNLKEMQNVYAVMFSLFSFPLWHNGEEKKLTENKSLYL